VVSAERIAQELKKMLVDAHRRRAMELCAELGLLSVTVPEFCGEAFQSQWDRVLRGLALLSQPTFELAMAVLLQTIPAEPQVQAICRRLRLSNEECERITWLVAHQADLQDVARW